MARKEIDSGATDFDGPLTEGAVEVEGGAELGGVGAKGSGDGAVLIDEATVLVESTDKDALNLGAAVGVAAAADGTAAASCC